MNDPTTASDPWLRRVQALLSKAESTDFPDEAEALLAKAQELMARHAIDEAMLRRATHATGEIASEAITIPPPYASARSALLGAVARANECRAVIQGGRNGHQHCVVVGHRSDLAKTTTLFAALSLHATRAMLAAPVPLHDTPRRFRHAFLLAFGARVGERLRIATEAARQDAEASPSGASVALALVDRKDAVDHALAEQFPRLATMRRSASSVAGLRSGRAAADQASLGQPGVAGAGRGLPPAP